ncbi:MAG: YgiT-type zinc finger protein [Armatimonadetes bacterium]|nr:YgiT-type zinc finger protein [Armatimonadota bacterium]
MRCHVCGGRMEPGEGDMPFRLGPCRIVIVKAMPVLECGGCGECLIDDPTMAHVEDMLGQVDAAAVLEVLRYAA